MKSLIIAALLFTLTACGKSTSKSAVAPAPESKVMEDSTVGSGPTGGDTKVAVTDDVNSEKKKDETSVENQAPVDAGKQVDDSTPVVDVPKPDPTAVPVKDPVIDTSKSDLISIQFRAKVGANDLRCNDKSSASVAEGQIFNDIRMFISNLSFIDDKGQEFRLTLDLDATNSNLQYIDKNQNGISLLNFIEAACATSDATKTVKTSITGTLPHGAYKELRFQLGLPYKAMSPELPSVPAALAPSDMGWMWEHYPADIQIETSNGVSKKMLNALTSSKKRITALPLSYTLTDGSSREVALNLDFANLFKSDAAHFVSDLENCSNATKAPLESAPNCAFAFKALGLEVTDALTPYEQTLFSIAK